MSIAMPARELARFIHAEGAALRRLAARLEAARARQRGARERAARAFLARIAAAGLAAADGARLVLAPEELPRPRRWPAAERGAARPRIYCARARDRRARPLPVLGFARGVAGEVLSLDAASGAVSLRLRLAPGAARPGGRSAAGLEIYVLAGAIAVGGERRGPGSFVYVPRGVALPALASPAGAELLAFTDGAPDFVATDSDDPRADRDRLVALDADADLPWQAQPAYPAAVAGRLVKVLRADAASRALTALVALAPGYRRDAVLYAEAATERYVIAGSRWSLAAGTCPAGSYAYLPPFTNDGPEAAPRGALLLVRSDAELVEHAHADPWSTPAENRAAARAELRRTRPTLFGRTRR